MPIVAELSLTGVDYIKYYIELFRNQTVSVKDVFDGTTITGTYISGDATLFTVFQNPEYFSFYRKSVRYIEVDNDANPTSIIIYL